ncbi:WD40-repeat-containing domain protein [Pisolithus orientalis]|uniref:WD40-repeat-containing domain protein n=1 Tax=Pisolithus orientalis TaxID=936130 RepID=UPI00222502C5|nr:WD40-repeat-containing domain protein [Pisolithus orientalis]KAI6001068.1 WD40-repeat-containing domain protein [Pisolithus orientalis]
MVLQETVLCATAPQPSGSGQGAFVLHDLQAGTTLATFRQTSSAPHCSAFIETANGQGGIMIGAQMDKSVLNVYNFQRDQIALKIILPEKLSCLALDQSANYCAGGTSHGRIYLWEVASGILYNAWDAHYRQVNVLKFTADGIMLISGSEDSGVSVWSIPKLVDHELQNELPLPQFTLSDHTLPVTDVFCGVGPFPKCRVLTSSLDHTVKLWDLATQSLMTTFHFPRPVCCVVWDVSERMFFAGSPDGSVHQVNLFRERDHKFGGKVIEAIGGAGTADLVRVDDPESVAKTRLITVERPSQPVTALSISITASLLLPPDLVGHISLSLNVASSAEAKDVIPRMRDPKAREAHEVTMMLPVQDKTPYNNGVEYDYPDTELQNDYAFFVRPAEQESSGLPSSARVAELEEEVQQLREQLSRAKGVNDAMWETVVQKLLSQGKHKELIGEKPDVEYVPLSAEASGSDRSRKRVRK